MAAKWEKGRGRKRGREWHNGGYDKREVKRRDGGCGKGGGDVTHREQKWHMEWRVWVKGEGKGCDQ